MKKTFNIPRPFVVGYAAFALLFSLLLGANALSKDPPFFLLTLIFYFVTAALGIWKSQNAAPYIAALALLSGWLETTFSGYNIDISAGILCLGVGAALLSMKHDRQVRLHPAAAALFLLAILTAISYVFVFFRVTSFIPEPGFSYMNYAVNLFGRSSDATLLIVLGRTANIFSWFGLIFLTLNSTSASRKSMSYIVPIIIFANFVAILFQQFLSPEILLPLGQYPGQRLNGLTSYSYALGAAMEILFILAPIWFFRKFRLSTISALTALLGTYAIYFSGSRTALVVIALTASAWLMVWLYSKIQLGRAAKIGIITTVIVALLFTSYIVISSTPANSKTAIGRLVRDIHKIGFVNAAYTGRAVQYPLILAAMSDFPVSGFGVGSFHYQISSYQKLNHPGMVPMNAYVMNSNAPNMYLGIASELGILSLFLFAFAVFRVALERSDRPKDYSLRSIFLLAGFLVYSFGIIVGPQLYNAEAAPWYWIFCGSIIWSRRDDNKDGARDHGSHPVWFSYVAIAAASLFFIIFNLQAQSRLDPNRQWQQLRWHINIGFFPAEETGQWSGPQAAMLLEKGRFALIRWHTGAEKAEFATDVQFRVEGSEVLHKHAGSGEIQTTLLVMPDAPGNNRLLTINVEPPFIPAEFEQSNDTRNLGIFLHSVEMLEGLEEWVGFYEEEKDSLGRTFRWCAQDGYMPLPGADAWRLHARSLKLPDASTPVTLNIKMNSATLKSIELSNNWTEIYITRAEILEMLGNDARGPFVIHLEADRTYRPSDISDAEDDRELAFAITEPESVVQ